MSHIAFWIQPPQVRVREVWFDEDPKDVSGFDLLKYHQRSRPTFLRNWLYYYTILIDINIDQAKLLSQMRNNNQQQIRRAINKDNLHSTFHYPPSIKEVEEFNDFNLSVCGSERKHQMDRYTLDYLAGSGFLALSKVRTIDGRVLVWHVYLCHPSQGRARCHLSVSLKADPSDTEFKNLLGRANRLLHFQDMIRLREAGIYTYDFGGWYPKADDQKLLNINRFKEGFGGKVVMEYETESPISFWGRIYIGLRKFKWLILDRHKWREFTRRRMNFAHCEGCSRLISCPVFHPIQH